MSISRAELTKFIQGEYFAASESEESDDLHGRVEFFVEVKQRQPSKHSLRRCKGKDSQE